LSLRSLKSPGLDETILAGLPLGPGERERHMQIELACRYYAKGWP
jgi:hypothetical protein